MLHVKVEQRLVKADDYWTVGADGLKVKLY